jgi:hypothetical protein
MTPFAIGIAFLALLTVLRYDLVSGTLLRTISQHLTGQYSPVKPFNKHHYNGVHMYRLFYENPKSGEEYPVLETFDEDGWQNLLFYPRYYEASAFVVTDYCLQVTHNNNVSTEKELEVIDLCAAGLQQSDQDIGNIHLYIKDYDGYIQEYLQKDWKKIGICRFGENDIVWENVNRPPNYEMHPRLEFDPSLKNA